MGAFGEKAPLEILKNLGGIYKRFHGTYFIIIFGFNDQAL